MHILIFSSLMLLQLLVGLISPAFVTREYTISNWNNQTRNWSQNSMLVPRRAPLVAIITPYCHSFFALLSIWKISMLILGSKFTYLRLQSFSFENSFWICRTQRKLRNNEICITADNYPALLYEDNNYDPEDVEHGLLCNWVLVQWACFLNIHNLLRTCSIRAHPRNW